VSAYQRRKGSSAERELCALLNAEFGCNVSRKLGQARDAGNDVDLPPFVIECKRRARIGNVYDWISQAEFATPDGYGMPVVMMRADGQDWLVLMRFIDWARLAREEISDARNTNTNASVVVHPGGGGSVVDAGGSDRGGD